MTESRKTKKPTMSDVARLAGVGPATVDRVLNERDNVSEEIRRKVIDAAREIGLRRILPQTYRPMIRVGLILARPELPLLRRMADEFRHIARNAKGLMTLHITTLKKEHPDVIAKALRGTDCDCVVIYAQDASEINAAISELSERGIPVITMISDLPGSRRLAYAGTDHFGAGRTAGFFLSMAVPDPGSIVILCNHLGFQSHAERVAGLRSYLKEKARHLEVARLIEGHDDRDRSRMRLEAAFREIPETAAIYNVGAANVGVRAAIESDIIPRRPIFIGHELTVHTAKMLRDGIMTLVIDQSPKLQAQFAIEVIMDHFGHEDVPVKPPYRSNVPLVLYGPEYIPPGFD